MRPQFDQKAGLQYNAEGLGVFEILPTVPEIQIFSYQEASRFFAIQERAVISAFPRGEYLCNVFPVFS